MVGLLYLLAAAVVFLPGIINPDDWTGTEGRRVLIALEMLQHGDWLVPTLGGEPMLSKPPLHSWVLVGIARWVGTDPWMMRLPGAFAFGGLAWLAHGLVTRSHGAAAAWCAGLGTLLSPLAVALVPRAEIDPLFAALAAASILLLSRGAAFASRSSLLIGGVIAGLAILVKGPPFFMLLAGTAAVWIRRRQARGLGLALLVMAIAPALYYVALGRAVAGLDTLIDVAAVESVGRLTLFDWEHVLDTPLHFGRALLSSLPFGLLLFFEYRGERPAEPDRGEAFLRMVAAAAFSTVLILALFPARPPRYLLPAVPLFFVAVSPSVAAFLRVPVLPALGRGIVRGLALVGAVGLCATPWLPAPCGARTALGLLFAAMLPLLVINGRRAVIAMLALPVVAMWTVFAPFAQHRAHWREPYAHAGATLARVLAERQASDLATLLHVASPILLHAGVLPPGDELAQREPHARWLLTEADAKPQEAWEHVAKATLPPKDYVIRARVQLPRRAVLLWEHM